MSEGAPRASRDPAVPLGWARTGIGLAVLGYTAVFLHGILRLPWDPRGRVSEILAALLACAAFALSRRRPRLATALVLAAVWTESAFSLASAPGLRTTAYVVFPFVVVAAGLLAGERIAAGFAAATTVLLLGVTTARGAWASAERVSQAQWVLVTAVVSIGAAALSRAVRRAYAAALEESERTRSRYAELFQGAPDGLVALDASGLVAEVNAAACGILGAGPEELRGLPPEEALRRGGARDEVDLSAAAATPLTLTLTRGKDPRFVEIAANRGVGGGALLVIRDVTARRLVEERLGHAQRLEAVGQVAGGVAHDFNNLLTALSGNAAVLAEHADPEVRELAGELEDARRRGVALTRQLLAFARRELRSPERVDLAETVVAMRRLLERLLGERHRLSLAAEAAPVVADRAQLEQIALNLVANARDAMPEGGTVTVEIRPVGRAAAAVLGSPLDAQRQAVLEVSDTGVGMAPEVQGRIFEPFFSTKPRGQGTGLGLATVHGIVVQSGGHVGVESAPGRGARFRVFLPLSQPCHAPAASAPQAATPGGTERVLLVEDDPNVRSLVRRLLGRAGYRVEPCASAEEALARLPALPDVALLLADVRLPGLGGPELAARIRAAHPGLAVLLMSGYWEDLATGRRPVDPALDLLQKPFEPSELLRRVRAALEKSVGVPVSGGVGR